MRITVDIGAVTHRVDDVQQRNTPIAFVFAVIKKFGDDRGPLLASLLTYYGFLSLFPALLVLTTVLGFIGNEQLTDTVIGRTLAEFPVIGEQIGRNAVNPLQGSPFALVFGLLGLLYGSLGSTGTAQFAMAEVWNIPVVDRPGWLPKLLRSLLFLAVLAAGIVASVALSAMATLAHFGVLVSIVSMLGAVAVNIGMYIAGFRVLTPKEVGTRDLIPGAVFAGIAYSILLTVGTALVQHQLRNAQAVYGQFALVLGLMSWLALVAQVSVYAAEINVVWAKRLWPRSLAPPPLTPADKQVLADIAAQEERRPEEDVDVDFEAANSGRSSAG